ncbi:hypothetical protein OQA88_10155 [Cercophora sp. LCS_1]
MKDKTYPLLSRREVETLITEGRKVFILDQFVVKADAWIPFHPGGEKAILHMVGRDATDEVTALHSPETTRGMSRYRIGRIEGRWQNLTPPIQGGKVRPLFNVGYDDSASLSSPASSSTSSCEGSDGEGPRRRGSHGMIATPSTSSISSLSSREEDDGMAHLDLVTKEKITLDLDKYPALDNATQDEVIAKYRALNDRVKAEGLYDCNYWCYFVEIMRYSLLFTGMLLLLSWGWYIASAICMGMFWHLLSFSAHDAGHIGITHDYHTDSVLGILIADFIGGMSIGWWKRNHNIHHIVTNSPDHDPDIEYLPFLAVSHQHLRGIRSSYYDIVMEYDAVAQLCVKFQRYSYYPLMLFGRFNLYRLSWLYLLGGQAPKKGPSWWHWYLEIVGQFCFWLWYGYGIIYRSIPTNSSRLAFLLVSHMFVAPLHVQLTLSHFAMSTAELGPQESFPQKMLRTAQDVDCPPWLDFFHGGLQFQVIHHLFPRIPRHNLRRAQKLIQEFCNDVGIPYALYGFVHSNKQVVGALSEVSRQAAILAKCQRTMANHEGLFSLARFSLSVFSPSERFEVLPAPSFFSLPRYLARRRSSSAPEEILKSAPPSPSLSAIDDDDDDDEMGLKLQESADPKAAPVEISKTASSPLGKDVPLASISGATYVTSQLLVQQTAYKLSDKIFSYSPETFDLDQAVKDWSSAGEKNIHGETTTVIPLQTRTGAGAFALGYIFSKDFDLSKRHIPQTLLAPSLSLRHLRSALDQLSLLYGVASPFVAHIAAADYSANDGLVTEYESALQIAEELGLGLITSSSAYEAQHTALLATLLASVLPTLHIYDGLRTARETLRVVDALGEDSIAEHYKNVARAVGSLNKRLDTAGKVIDLLRAFNDEFGTSYAPFEYHGHEEPDSVLVVFGSVESQLAKQVVDALAGEGKRVGVVNVRVYRPFIEEAFLEVLPSSVSQVAVLGQVRDAVSVDDPSIQSALYSDVLTAVSFTDKWGCAPTVVDVKYAASTTHTPSSIASVLLGLDSKAPQVGVAFSLSSVDQAEQFTFWDVDNSVAVEAPSILGALFAKESANNVYVHEVYDNVLHGGVVRTDIRSSRRSIEAPYDVQEADVVLVGEEKLLKEVDILKGVKTGGKLILRLPSFKAEDLEKRIPALVRKRIQEKAAKLFVLDASSSPALEKDAQLLVELAFLKVARPELTLEQLTQFEWLAQDQTTLTEIANSVDQALSSVEIPASWTEVADDVVPAPLAQGLTRTSFVGFQKEEPEQALDLQDWQAAAKGLAFKEAYGTKDELRPDLTVKTFTIHVKENRRLTPLDYDRNIFHIEFDLGNSGLTYNIGEALGIHAENDPKQVLDFIQFYGLNADDVVEVPSRENVEVTEVRTVYQALVQNIDILGKPPKRFFESLAEFATDEQEKKKLEFLGGKEGAEEFKKLSEVDTVTYVDIFEQFKSAHPSFHDLVKIVSPLKRREYSIASAQAVTPTSVSLMIVVVDWVDTKGRTRYGQATRYLSGLAPGTAITASVKPSVMKLPVRDTAPLIMAGLGTGLAPFRAFVQYRAMQKAQGKEIGSILLYLGSRHQREEYLYGEEWEAYLDAGVITLLGAAFSRDQPQKIYIQDRMRQTLKDIVKAYIEDDGSFYLCGPTWPVPDVTAVLEEAIAAEAKASGRKVDPRKEIEQLKEDGRYVLEVY